MLSGCGGPDPLSVDGERVYVADDVAWAEGQDPIERVTVRVEGGRLSVQAGCNTLSTYDTEVDGGRLVTDGLVTTDMGCGADVLSQQDEWLASLLSAEPEIEVSAERLDLRSADAGLSAEARP